MNTLICKSTMRSCDYPKRCCHDCSEKHECQRLHCVNIPKTCGYCVDPEAKDTSGKPRLALVSPYLIEAVGAVRTYGTDKYGDPDNWKLVDAASYKDAMMRHLCVYLKDPAGVDAESGLPHLWHLACNVNFLIEMESCERS